LQIDEKDIGYEATRSGGPGGQHVNKVSTAVRATHKPTGLAVLASNSRSQLQNKKAARERLIQLLKLKQLDNRKEVVQANWQNHNELERGNPIRVFKGSNFKSEYVTKTYKSKRQKQKLELKKLNFKD
jgi:peptide chain release factor